IEVEGKMLKRLIFEYSAKVSMMLRYDTNQGMIVMDNLAPVNSLFAGDPRHYGPDFTHNALKFEKGRWVFHSDVIVTNAVPYRQLTLCYDKECCNPRCRQCSYPPQYRYQKCRL